METTAGLERAVVVGRDLVTMPVVVTVGVVDVHAAGLGWPVLRLVTVVVLGALLLVRRARPLVVALTFTGLVAAVSATLVVNDHEPLISAQAIELAHQHQPDVCLLDIRMPVLDGLDTTRQLAGTGVADPLAVVILTTFDNDELGHEALEAGARGFLLKDTATDLLLHAIHAAAAGDALIAPHITGRLLARFADAARNNTEPAVALTDREREILALSPAATPTPRSPRRSTSA